MQHGEGAGPPAVLWSSLPGLLEHFKFEHLLMIFNHLYSKLTSVSGQGWSPTGFKIKSWGAWSPEVRQYVQEEISNDYPHFFLNWIVSSLSTLLVKSCSKSFPSTGVQGKWILQRWWGLRRWKVLFRAKGTAESSSTSQSRPAPSMTLSQIFMQGEKMMTSQFLQEKVNKTSGSWELALSHGASGAELTSGLNRVNCSHEGKRKD